MEESIQEHRVVPELYFLIAKFLSGGPLKETAKTLLKELETIEVLPRRLDWEGNEHTQSYEELNAQYSDVSWHRLATVCERALQLARHAPVAGEHAAPQGLAARLSLLSESLVRPLGASHRRDHTLVRRLVARELGVGTAALPAGRGGQAVFPPRMLGSLNLQRRTLGHLSAVYCVVFDCTGRYVITGADDMLVKIWSAVDGRLAGTLRGVGAEVTDVCATADGALVACGSVDRLVRVWCLRTGEPRAVLAAHAGTITSVHWAPAARRDVRWLASTSTDCSVAFWTCSPDGHFLSQPVQYVERMRPGVCHMICAAWSAGGAFLAAGSADHHVRVYTVEHEPGGPKRVLETAVHDDAVDSIAWAHRGLRFVSGSKDGRAALWTLHATQWRHVLLQPAAPRPDGKKLKMTMVCWDCSDAYVFTAVSDNTIRVWCSRTCTQVRVLSGHRDEAYVLEAHPFLDGVFLSAGHDGQLFVWDAGADTPLARFHNRIDGHGDGAIFDAKWGGGASVAATDSHGHLLLLGLGRGHRLYAHLPTELFFHTDYRPVVVDAAGGAHDEQTDTPPHLLPPPFLVDVEGAPHAPEYQRLVPGRENLALSQLIPAADAPRSQINSLIEALAAGAGAARGVWRGEGVRYTAGSWQRGDPLLLPARARHLVPPLPAAARERLHRAAADLNALEQAWYRREMRRRPLMISTAPAGDGAGPRRRAGRRPAPAPRPDPPEPRTDSADHSDTSDEWPSGGRARARSPDRSSADSRDDCSSLDLDDTTSSSSSSQYSDWQTGAALAPPRRARRRPVRPTRRYSPAAPAKRAERPPPAPAPAVPAAPAAEPAEPADPLPEVGAPEVSGRVDELPDAYRPGEWITAVSPRKAPYHPQMGDQCLYFRLGHQKYFEAVAEKDVYKINPRDKPWESAHVYECELVKVVGIKYAIKPPRVVCLRLACELGPAARSLTVRYHDMPDVIDFLVLRQQYDAAVQRRWGAGDRFRCMIDDCWWTGEVLERAGSTGSAGAGDSAAAAAAPARDWAAAAAAHFLALQVRWDNGEVERLSPWDLEPLDPARLPAAPGGAVPVLPRDLDAVLYRARDDEWGGDRATACRAIAEHIGSVMSLAVAEPFVAPVDLQQYPAYARVVPYPVDLATIRARCSSLFYRRAAAAQFDARYLASNAERFNEPHAAIVRQARLVTDLLLHIIAQWRHCDVLAKYHELADNYRSSDDEPLLASKARSWRAACTRVLHELCASADAEPFRAPVQPDQAPDYALVVVRPMDLGTVRARLAAGEYTQPDQFVADVRQVFANSRLYNTNKRSRIYSMTVRLSALFEALWSRHGARAAPRRARRAPGPRPRRTARANNELLNGGAWAARAHSASSDSETLAATSRRVHAADRAGGGAHDSWDSDAPLRVHSKGKGVGKKSKSKSSSASAEPVAGPSRDLPAQHGQHGHHGQHVAESYSRVSGAWSRSSSSCDIEVLEEQLHSEAELVYSDSDTRARTRTVRPTRPTRNARPARCVPTPRGRRRARKRRRGSSDSGGHGARRGHYTKRTRERVTDGSTSSSSASSDGSSLRRYESDRSYHPRYSTDDDRPLHLYRDRDRAAASAHSSNSGGVSLRARQAQRRYNEDSEEDSVAAISKRLQHHARAHHAHHAHLATRRRHHAAQSASAEVVSSHRTDHNYFNGHAAHAAHDAHSAHATLADHSRHAQNSNNGGSSSSAEGGAGTASTASTSHTSRTSHTSHTSHTSRLPPAVSISSRGRVRKLTPKARGLLHD